MENASKALIIAGAILISILLISVGVLIMNSTGSTQDSVQQQADAIAIRTFNSQFTPYEGHGISASQIKSLFSAINATKKSDHVVSIDDSSDIKSTSALTNNGLYNVEVVYGEDGYAEKIIIKK